jgi:hypothetical protein
MNDDGVITVPAFREGLRRLAEDVRIENRAGQPGHPGMRQIRHTERLWSGRCAIAPSQPAHGIS